MAKVKVISTFIGTPEENEKFGGQIPASQKDFESKMSAAEKNAFKGRITAGTEIEVDDKRAHELASVGVVEMKGVEKVDLHDTRNIPVARKATEKVSDVTVKDEKNKEAGPNAAKK